MHQVMLNASTFSSPWLSFDYRQRAPFRQQSYFLLSLRNKSAEELSVPVPCTLSSRHFTLPIVHSFSLQNQSLANRAHRPSSFPSEARHQTSQKVRRNFQADRGIERAILLFTRGLIFTSVAAAHKHRRACVDILKWKKI